MKKLNQKRLDILYGLAGVLERDDKLEYIAQYLIFFILPAPIISFLLAAISSLFESMYYGLFVITPFTLGVFRYSYLFMFYTSLYVVVRILWIWKRFTDEQLTYLPAYLYQNRGWVNIIKALDKASKNHVDKTHRKVFSHILTNLFVSTPSRSQYNIIGDESKSLRMYDIENAVLWSNYLMESPLLERVSLLMQLKTKEEWNAFNNRMNIERIEFMKPFDEFSSYISKIKSDTKYRREELKNQNIKVYEEQVEKYMHMRQKRVQNRIDAVMKFAMNEENVKLKSIGDIIDNEYDESDVA